MRPSSTDNHPPAEERSPAEGRFGVFGGRFAPETLMEALIALEAAWREAMDDPVFMAELDVLGRDYAGRPSPLYEAERLAAHWGGARVWFKREELNHTGSHKINNVLGQAALARRMGKRRIIAETGAGQHGVAAATAAARFGMVCDVYMGTEDIRRQASNVARMRLLGARVHPVATGRGTLKDAMNEAMRVWSARVEDTYYLIGTAAGPHPYPAMVRTWQSVIGREARAQFLERVGVLPDAAVACVGGGSNAIGLFSGFMDDPSVRLVGAEAGGAGGGALHAAALVRGSAGALHGAWTYVLQDEEGQIRDAESLAPGLDYPAVGPELAYLRETGRATFVAIEDARAIRAFGECSRLEGIIPALEPAHALAAAEDIARSMTPREAIVVNLCGRGDKDLQALAERAPALFAE